MEGTGLTGDSVALGAGGKFVDKPTITYAPLTGEEFAKAFLTPIRPSTIFFLMQSGWPVDRLFPLTVDSINGLRGVGSFVGSQDDGDPKYYRVIRLLRKIQLSNASGMQVERTESLAETSILLFHRERIAPDILAAMAELREILGLRPGLEKIKVRFGSAAKDDTEIAIITRSLMHMMVALSRQVDVPIEDIEAGRTLPTIDLPDIDSDDLRRLIQISHGTERPADAFTAVKYLDHWFWIDNGDLRSKRTLSFLLILFSLTETGGEVGLPLITIPTS